MLDSHHNMIWALTGTKGQLIKIAPVLLELKKRNIEYKFIHAGQHAQIIMDLLKQFGLKKPDIYLYNVGEDVSNEKQIMSWLAANIYKYVIKKGKNLIGFKKNDLILNHGDAPPALLGVFLAKAYRVKSAHIEAGERTYNLFNPFPEEIIRRIVDRYSTYKFASSKESYRNLIHEKLQTYTFNIQENTLLDAVRFAIKQKGTLVYNTKFVLASIHRYETIRNKKKMSILVNFLNIISDRFPVVFPLHPSTESKLRKFKLLNQITSNENIIVSPLFPYVQFIQHINACQFIITDGGGPQQESYYLGKPCLVMRQTSERLSFQNVVLSKFDSRIVRDFVDNYHAYSIKKSIDLAIFPSCNIINILLEQNLIEEI